MNNHKFLYSIDSRYTFLHSIKEFPMQIFAATNHFQNVFLIVISDFDVHSGLEIRMLPHAPHILSWLMMNCLKNISWESLDIVKQPIRKVHELVF